MFTNWKKKKTNPHLFHKRWKFRVEFQFYSDSLFCHLFDILIISQDIERRLMTHTRQHPHQKNNNSICTGHTASSADDQGFLPLPSPSPGLRPWYQQINRVRTTVRGTKMPLCIMTRLIPAVGQGRHVFFPDNCILLIERCTISHTAEEGPEGPLPKAEESTQLQIPPFANLSISSKFPCGKRQ